MHGVLATEQEKFSCDSISLERRESYWYNEHNENSYVSRLSFTFFCASGTYFSWNTGKDKFSFEAQRTQQNSLNLLQLIFHRTCDLHTVQAEAINENQMNTFALHSCGHNCYHSGWVSRKIFIKVFCFLAFFHEALVTKPTPEPYKQQETIGLWRDVTLPELTHPFNLSLAHLLIWIQSAECQALINPQCPAIRRLP